MRIIHLSYHISRLSYTDPDLWLRRINSTAGVLESMSGYAEVSAIYHIRYEGKVFKNNVIYYFPRFSKMELVFPIRFNRYIKALKPDVVIVHGLIFPWQVLMLRWLLGSKTKIIAQHHAEKPLRDVRQFIQRWADRHIGAYLFCSIEQGQQWVGRGQISDIKKVKEIMGTSSPFYVIDREAARSVTKVTGEPAYLWVGRLDNNKDPLLVAKAFIRFAETNPSAKLYMIYQTFQLFDELEKIVVSASARSDAIHLIGKVSNDELQYWYNSAEFIISSSHYEGSGVAVCEGLSCGCIPILTNIPSFRMMTDNGRTGLLYQSGDEEGLLDCLNKSLKLDRQEMKQRVLKQFNDKLSFEANARRIMEVIHSI